jgi:hypothetical protein
MHGGDAGTFGEHSLHILDKVFKLSLASFVAFGSWEELFPRIAYFGPLSQIPAYIIRD